MPETGELRDGRTLAGTTLTIKQANAHRWPRFLTAR